MTNAVQELVDEAVRILVREAQPEQIILFGSYARGDARSGSDLDLLIVESEPFTKLRSRFQELVRLERALGRLPIGTDVLVYDRYEAQTFARAPNHVVARALREGRILYARS
jgi:predicted nucleotidyltransferase